MLWDFKKNDTATIIASIVYLLWVTGNVLYFFVIQHSQQLYKVGRPYYYACFAHKYIKLLSQGHIVLQ